MYNFVFCLFYLVRSWKIFDMEQTIYRRPSRAKLQNEYPKWKAFSWKYWWYRGPPLAADFPIIIWNIHFYILVNNSVWEVFFCECNSKRIIDSALIIYSWLRLVRCMCMLCVSYMFEVFLGKMEDIANGLLGILLRKLKGEMLGKKVASRDYQRSDLRLAWHVFFFKSRKRLVNG